MLTFIAVIFSLFALAIWLIRRTGKDQPVEGAVFVTGCDSGMGENTAFHLAKVGYQVYAAVYMKESFAKYEDFKNITPVQLDVSKEESIADALEFVESHIEDNGIKGLYGVLQCAGVAYVAPFEYMSMESFRRQVEVNFFGYVAVAKAFMPLVKKSVSKKGARRGRFAFVSSGPVPGPGVPFISPYLASKWAGDAFCQCIRMEFRMRQIPIDCVMISPGVVKPTALAEVGERILERTFSEMPKEATTEYREMVNTFRTFQLNEPGTHVSVVGQQMEKLMRDGIPFLRYYVGVDAKASFIVGLLPTGLKEFLLRNTLLGKYDGGVPKLGFWQ